MTTRQLAYFLVWLSLSQLLLGVAMVRIVLTHRQHRSNPSLHQPISRLQGQVRGLSDRLRHHQSEPILHQRIDLAPLSTELRHLDMSLRDHLHPDPPPFTTPHTSSQHPSSSTTTEKIMAILAKRRAAK